MQNPEEIISSPDAGVINCSESCKVGLRFPARILLLTAEPPLLFSHMDFTMLLKLPWYYTMWRLVEPRPLNHYILLTVNIENLQELGSSTEYFYISICPL